MECTSGGSINHYKPPTLGDAGRLLSIILIKVHSFLGLGVGGVVFLGALHLLKDSCLMSPRLAGADWRSPVVSSGILPLSIPKGGSFWKGDSCLT